MESKKIKSLLQEFAGRKICIVGDVMLDRYVYGDITRISPEAPVPVVLAQKETIAIGGAGNVAANVASLGGAPFLVSVIGKDRSSQDLLSNFSKAGINPAGILRLSNRPTTEKVRIIAQNQQIARVDREFQDDIDIKLTMKLLSFLHKYGRDFDGFIISDYAKGVITKILATGIIGLARKYRKFVICDTKPQHAKWFKRATLFAPNEKEALATVGANDIVVAGRRLQAVLRSDILITRGAEGMMLFTGSRRINFPTKAREVFDVTGAGDTVMAALALSLASGATLKDAVVIANYAAGIVVGKSGTATVFLPELRGSFKDELLRQQI